MNQKKSFDVPFKTIFYEKLLRKTMQVCCTNLISNID